MYTYGVSQSQPLSKTNRNNATKALVCGSSSENAGAVWENQGGKVLHHIFYGHFLIIVSQKVTICVKVTHFVEEKKL